MGWILLSVASYLVMNAGVNDRFYFDDYSNLAQLGDNGGVTNWESFKAYLASNPSGPTGRPISVVSFLIDDNSWPSSASAFKKTNILIHLLIGFLLFWVALIFFKDYQRLYKVEWPFWAPLFVAAFWLFNPLHLSTVLYPVQRMAQLSTLFSLAGILAYMKLRPLVSLNPSAWFPVLVFSVGVLYVLSVFSKENGILLPIYLLILEVHLYKKIYPLNKFLTVASNSIFFISVLSILTFLVYVVVANGWTDAYAGRDFSPYQRLVTQSSILFWYLKELFFPSLYTTGLYYDHLKHAETFFSFPEAISSLSMIAVLSAAIMLFKKGSLTAFALLFYFSAHLLESTVIGLELAFEHRNYMASIFLGLVVIDLIRFIPRRLLKNCIMVVLLGVFFLITIQRSTLWSDDLLFAAVIAKKAPNSVRSQVELNNALVSHGRLSDAIRQMREAVEANPDEIYLAMHSVLLDCIAGVDATDNADRLIDLAARRSFDGRNRLAVDKIYKFAIQKRCSFLSPEYFSRLLQAFMLGESVGRDEGEVSRRGLRILAQRFYLQFPEYAPGNIRPVSEVLKNKNPEYLMLSAATLASVGRYREALLLSDRALVLVKEGVLGTSSRSKESFLNEIAGFNRVVLEDLAKVK